MSVRAGPAGGGDAIGTALLHVVSRPLQPGTTSRPPHRLSWTLVSGQFPNARAAGLILGFVADQMLGDPRRGHPVALFGRAAGALERRVWADSRSRGLIHVAICLGGSVGVGVLARRLAGSGRLAETLVTGLATWTVL